VFFLCSFVLWWLLSCGCCSIEEMVVVFISSLLMTYMFVCLVVFFFSSLLMFYMFVCFICLFYLFSFDDLYVCLFYLSFFSLLF